MYGNIFLLNLTQREGKTAKNKVSVKKIILHSTKLKPYLKYLHFTKTDK